MKKTLILSLFFAANFCIAQPQWKFHIAFEDATGAKDTIWLIWDTTATGNINGYDTLLGEGPFNFNYTEFNVWTTNDLGDSTKTVALPYNAISFLPYVYAFNYQYPITIRWDSSLFHAPFLPLPVGYINRAIIDNDYFFGVNNNFPYHFYNMLIDESVVVPSFSWGSQSHFPMIFYIARDLSLKIQELFSKIYSIYPNPFSNTLSINTKKPLKKIEIISIEGKEIFSITTENLYHNFSFSTLDLKPGIYFLKILTLQNQTHYEKVIKIR